MLAAHGFFLLKRKGHPEGDLEDTTVLITSGAYKYIRHPLYTSLLIFGLGAFIKNPSWLGVLLVGLTILGVTLTAIREETHNIARFGEEYLSYLENTKRFIPYLY
jgi:protein-S-isoprenylcysteine O-methyltransferase Ste14